MRAAIKWPQGKEVSTLSVTSIKHELIRWIPALLLCSVSIAAQAAPWIAAGDLRMRHSLQSLSDQRALHAPTTTWPIMWSGVTSGLEAGDQSAVLTDSLDMAYVQFERGKQAKSGLQGEIQISGTSEATMFRSFASAPREESTGSIKLELVGDRFAVALNGHYATNPTDDEKERYDGSYLAFNAGNWVLGGGAIDRWWGPGWQSSLILSTNARPIPAVWINRKSTSAPAWRWLSWVGPWQLTMLAGQLEEERVIPDAKLLGARLTVVPIRGLELGFVRAIQWGGKGQSETSRTFLKALAGDSNEPGEKIGNELAGIDFRYGAAIGEATLGFYGQIIGEDEAGYAPTKRVGLIGFDAGTHLGQGSQRWFLEAANTIARDFYDDPEFQVAYNHSSYRSGYNYRGRNIGPSFAADARALTLGVMQFFANGHNLSLMLTDATLSVDGNSRAAQVDPDIRYFIPDARQPLIHASLRYELSVLGGWLTVQAEYADQPVVLDGEEADDWQLLGSWKYRF